MAVAAANTESPHGTDRFAECLALIRRINPIIHHAVADVMPDKKLTPIRVLTLYDMGDRTYQALDVPHLGLNGTHNREKLIKAGMLQRDAASGDNRVRLIRRTEAGAQIAAVVENLYERQARQAKASADLSTSDIAMLCLALRRLERYLGDHLRFRL